MEFLAACLEEAETPSQIVNVIFRILKISPYVEGVVYNSSPQER